MNSPFLYFTDAVLRAPTIGCMLMCLAAALIGTIAFLRKESLVGESLAHAAYPGILISLLLMPSFLLEADQEFLFSFCCMAGAFFSSFLGLWLIHLLQTKVRVRSDSALCFILSAFFGIGITLASRLQITHSDLYNAVQIYLYGQAATMRDFHVLLYGCLSAVVFLVFFLFYKEIKTMTFDRTYAKTVGMKVKQIDCLLFTLMALAIVIGMRSVGIVLMSAMLIVPTASARRYTHRFHMMLWLAALFGLLSGFFGNYLSAEINDYLAFLFPSLRLIFPTGPMIVLVATAIFLFSLLFAPEQGIFLSFCRNRFFRYRCHCENILKAMWRHQEALPLQKIAYLQSTSSLYARFILRRLIANGWLIKQPHNTFSLTKAGKIKAAHIVRLHRLWEVYLVDYLGMGAERVHRNAEEMEHILTPQLEQQLTLLLKDPRKDPHQQPIPFPEEIL